MLLNWCLLSGENVSLCMCLEIGSDMIDVVIGVNGIWFLNIICVCLYSVVCFVIFVFECVVVMSCLKFLLYYFVRLLLCIVL